MSWILFSSLSDSFPSIPLKPFFPLTSSLSPLLLFLCCTSAANLQIPPFIWINVFLMRTAHYLLLFCGIDLLTLLLPAHQQDLSSDHFSFPSCSSQKTLRTHAHAHTRTRHTDAQKGQRWLKGRPRCDRMLWKPAGGCWLMPSPEAGFVLRLLSNTNGASFLVHLSCVSSAVGPSHTWLNRNMLRMNQDNWAFSKANRLPAQTGGRLPLTAFHLTAHSSFSVPLT